MTKKYIGFIIGIVLICNAYNLNAQETGQIQENERNWTHFRGSNLNGISEETQLPVSWNDTNNVAWKVQIGGKGWSSPVVWGDQVWCTTASTNGKEMYAVCMDFNSGKELFNLKLFEPDTLYRIHGINTYASPSPCIEEGFVYVHFGRYGTACINTENGRIVWKREDLICKHGQGPGSSLILYNNMLIIHLEGMDVQNIIAVDKLTGEEIWKIDRPLSLYEPLAPIGRKACTTPIVINVNGRDLLISNGSAVCIAYDVNTGEEVWRIPQGEDSTIAMPVESDGIIYFYTSFVTPFEGDKYCELIAVDPDGEGDITDSNIIWRKKSPILQLPTPVVKNGLLYTIDSEAELRCMDALSGETIWSEKLKGKYHSSPIWAAGNIYYSSTRGETSVIREGRAMEVVSLNSLEGEIWATPAFVDGSIVLRTSKYLYRIQ
jgi:outer membrane protein assembly factor BamB